MNKKLKLIKINLAKIFILITIFVANSSLAKQNTLKIALAGPFSGPYAKYGTNLLSGAATAIADLNQNGGIKGINLEIIPLDDKCQAKNAIDLAKDIIKKNEIHAIIGHLCSSATLATADLYADANLLMVTPTSTNPKITQKGIATLFRMCGRDDRQALAPANFLKNKINSQRIAILHDQDLYGKDLADHVSEQLALRDITPVLYQGIPHGTKKFMPLINKFKELKIDAVFFAGLYPEVASMAKIMHEQHLQIPLLSGDSIALQAFANSAGKNATSSVILSFTKKSSDIQESQEIIAKMQKENLETSGYALYAYAAVQVIAEAIRNTDTTNGKSLAHWLHQNNVNTVLGNSSWDTNGDIIDGDFQIYIWNKQGDFIRAFFHEA